VDIPFVVVVFFFFFFFFFFYFLCFSHHLIHSQAYTEDQESRKFGARNEMTKRISVAKDSSKDTLDIDQAIKSLKKVNRDGGTLSPREGTKGQASGPSGVVLRSGNNSAGGGGGGGKDREKDAGGEEGERMFKLRPTNATTGSVRGGNGPNATSPPRSPTADRRDNASSPIRSSEGKPLPKVSVEKKEKRDKVAEKLSKSASVKGEKKGKLLASSKGEGREMTRAKSRDDLKVSKRKEVKKSSKDTVISPRVAGEKKEREEERERRKASEAAAKRDKQHAATTSPKREKTTRSDSKKRMQVDAAILLTQSAGPTLTTVRKERGAATNEASSTHQSARDVPVASVSKSDGEIPQSTSALVATTTSIPKDVTSVTMTPPLEHGDEEKTSLHSEEEGPPPMRLPPTLPPPKPVDQAERVDRDNAREIGVVSSGDRLGLKEINASVAEMQSRKVSRSDDQVESTSPSNLSNAASPLSRSGNDDNEGGAEKRPMMTPPSIQISNNIEKTMVRSASFEANDDGEDGSDSSFQARNGDDEKSNDDEKSHGDMDGAKGSQGEGSQPLDQQDASEDDERDEARIDVDETTSSASSHEKSHEKSEDAMCSPSLAGSPTASTGRHTQEDCDVDEKAYREEPGAMHAHGTDSGTTDCLLTSLNFLLPPPPLLLFLFY
jgi:hypothetical protein